MNYKEVPARYNPEGGYKDLNLLFEQNWIALDCDWTPFNIQGQRWKQFCQDHHCVSLP